MFVVSLIIIFLSVVTDQIIKYFINLKIDMYKVVEVIKFGDTKIFSLTHVRNSGAAWSIMSGKTWFLIVLPIVVCLFAVVYLYLNRNKSKAELIAVSLFVGGGIGNLIDRIRIKEVIDYIRFEPVNFPIFNFADICVVVGAVLFVFSIFREDSKKSEKAVGDNG